MTTRNPSPVRRLFLLAVAVAALTGCPGRLEKRLLSDNPKTRERAMIRLKGLTPPARQALIKPMVEALQSADGRLANRAEEVLISIGEPAVDAVSAQLGSTDPFLRIISVNILGEIGARADTTVPSLIERLTDGHPLVREEAAHALGRFGAQAASAIPALQKAQSDEVPEVAEAATAALGQINKAAPSPTAPPTNPA